MSIEKTRGHDRTRLWTFIVYPESAPSAWRDCLDDLHLEWAESPLHEFDVNITGELKKPHWHVVISFDGPKSYEQVSDIISPLNCPAPQRCHSLKGAIRYFVHLDNPEKFQYPISGIVGHGGFDIAAALQPSSSERYSVLRDMCDYIKRNHVCEFSEFVYYAMAEHFDDWYPLLADNSAYFISHVIASERHKYISD